MNNNQEIKIAEPVAEQVVEQIAEPVADQVAEPVKRGRGRPKCSQKTTEDKKADRKVCNSKYYEKNREKILNMHAVMYKVENPEGSKRIYRKLN